MGKQNLIDAADAYDLLMGLSRLTGSELIADIAKVVGDLAPPALANALNRKQLASKLWLLDELHAHLGSAFGRITVLGGWYGVLSALLLHDSRFNIGQVRSVDLDPACQPVADLLNRRFAVDGRFSAVTHDMYALGPAFYGDDPSSLVINTSCEHIPDVRAWLDSLPRGQQVCLQSNDYRAVAEHISCVDSAEELAARARLPELVMTGALPTRNYTRFMVMGRT